MNRQRFLRRAAGWVLVLAVFAWLQTGSGIRAYDRLLQATDPSAVRQARADSLAAVAQARLEAEQRKDSVVAVVLSPPISNRSAHTQRADLWWLATLGIPIALFGFGLDAMRFRRGSRGAVPTGVAGSPSEEARGR